MSAPANVGGRVLVARGEILKTADYERFGKLIQQYINDGILGPLLGAADLSPISGFFGDSFVVSKINDSLITMGPGIGFLMAADAEDDEPAYRMVHQSVAFEIEVPTPSAPTYGRIDLVVIRPAESQTSEYRDMKNLDVSPTTITPQSVAVMARPSWDHDVYYIQGEEAESPVAPAVPAGFTAIAQVTKAPSSDTGAATVEDLRVQLKRGVDKQRRIKILSGDDMQLLLSFLEVMNYHSSDSSYSSSGPGFAAMGYLPLGLPVGAVLKRLTVTGALDEVAAALTAGCRVKTHAGAELLPGTDETTLSITGATGDLLTAEWTGSYEVQAGERLALEVAVDNAGTANAVRFLSVEVEYDE